MTPPRHKATRPPRVRLDQLYRCPRCGSRLLYEDDGEVACVACGWRNAVSKERRG